MSALIRQKQISSVATYDDTLAAGSGLEVAELADNINFNFNGLFSQINKIIGLTNWFDATPDTGGMSLNNFMNNFLCGAQVLTAVPITAAQNWEILSVAGSETPTVGGNIATATSTATEGAACSVSTLAAGAAFDAFELTLRTNTAQGGALEPINLVSVIDSTTRQPIQSDNGQDVQALLVAEASFTPNGGTIDDVSAGNRVKLVFVRVNNAGTALEACPVADIAGKSIFYNYPLIKLLGNVDPSCFTGKRGFVDQTASVDVTRQNAYANQGATVVTTTTNATLDIGDGLFWELGDVLGAALLTVTEGSTGGTSTVAIGADVDSFDVDAGPSGGIGSDFNKSINVESEFGTDILIGLLGGGRTGIAQTGTATGDFQLENRSTGGGGVLINDTTGSGTSNGTISLEGADQSSGALNATGIDLEPGDITGTGPTGTAGSVTITAGGDLTTGGTATSGSIFLQTKGGTSNIDESQAIVHLQNQGTGTGGGEDVQLYTGTSNPNTASVSADAASLFFQDTGGGAVLWLNTSTGMGTTWTALSTGSVEDRQDVYDNQGATVVTQGDYDATLDIGTGGRFWEIGDANSDTILRITESSALNTTQFLVNSDDITLAANAPTATGGGGTVNISSGTGGTGAGNAGGEVDVTAGDAGSGSNGAGGALDFNAGTGDGSGSGGNVDITAGSGGLSGTGGVVTITGGAGGATSGDGEGVSLRGGTGGGADGSGGGVDLIGGTGGTTNGAGGTVVIDAGPGTGTGPDGDILIGESNALNTNIAASSQIDLTSTGTGLDAIDINSSGGIDIDSTTDINVNTANAAVASPISLTGGDSSAGAGATVSLVAGAGGGANNGGNIGLFAADSGAGATGDGGNVRAEGGDALSTNGGGGGLTVILGDGAGTGTAGWLDIQGPNTNLEAWFTFSGGSGNAEETEFYSGIDNPNGSVDAVSSSLFFLDDGTQGTVYINVSSGNSGTDWEEIATSSDIATPAQESVTTQVVTGTDTALTDTLNSTPFSNASVRLYLNGVFQEQGAGLDYTISGTTITWLASSGTAVDMDTSDTLIAVYDT